MNTVLGLFDTREATYLALRDLTAAGFQPGQISVVTHDVNGEYTNYGGKATAAPDLLTYLASTGSIRHRATSYILSGPIGQAISENKAIGPESALVALGIPSGHANFYCEGVRRGSSLLAVTTGSDLDADRAQGILNTDGAVDIDARAATYRSEGFSAPTYETFPGTTVTRTRRYAYADTPVITTEERIL